MKHYLIKKKMTNEDGKVVHVLLTDGSSEILEYKEKEKDKAEKMVEVLNANSDSGWEYELIETGK
jgi:Mg-chelatase subunit ChlD